MFWGIVGHEWAITHLQKNIALGRDSHAILLSGMAGLGKRLLALRIAQALNCERSPADPCQACRSCRRIANGNHPDVRVAGMATQAAGLKDEEAARQKELKISTVREWQRDIALKPYEAQRRLFILHDADKLNEEASNAMLKTLEEPPTYATIILVADSAELLPTIVSRCQLYRLRPLPRQQVAAALVERAGLALEDAHLLAAWSGGRVGWALQMVEQPEELAARQEQLDTLIGLAAASPAERLRWAEQRSKEYRSGEQQIVFTWLELWQYWWRDVLLVAVDNADAIVNVDRRTSLEQNAARYDIPEIYRFASRIGATSTQLRENVNPQLALENLLLHLPRS
jgi:DNA polymerase-3 subunit delta'